MSDIDSVRVALRMRPLVESEINRGCQLAVEKVKDANQVLVNNADAFTFNFVFDCKDSQEYVYQTAVSDMLDKLFSGFNVTILAYGQTGSGKTHTMGTAFTGSLDETAGVIPRAMQNIFAKVDQLMNEYEFIVKCSFIELYQEQLYDLLCGKAKEESIVDIREDRNGVVMVGVTEKVVYSAQQATDYLQQASSGRAVAATAMNQQSSRSHAIFTITLQATCKDESRTVTTSKFHLVDLAGSERSKKTQATGDRFKEGVKINQGLLALGNVISALGEGKNAGFVRYRDSKLTRLLQDSLGGNSVTLMIACISPADYNVPETLSTLRYADRARKIKNKPIVNQDPHAAEINRLKGIIQKLRIELIANGGSSMCSSLTSGLENITPSVNSVNTSTPRAMPSEEQNRKYLELQEKYRNLQQQWQMIVHEIAEHEIRAHITEASRENLKVKNEEMKVIAEALLTVESKPLDEQVLLDKLNDIKKLIEDVSTELNRAEAEIFDHKERSSMMVSLIVQAGSTDPNTIENSDLTALVQEQTDAFTNKQMEINEQLRQINRELSLKEQLQQRITGNLSKYFTNDENIEEKIKECEQKIQELENEKSELLEKLRHVKENTSAKLAEDRRKRLQALEQEIAEMKRRNLQQAKLLKVREKETQKIRNLNEEIQAMKESKVKLIRTMRQESENFRQFKMLREKELMQLKNKDRKMQNEMARKEALHNKQRNVLKRKCEEAMAINKRLKDALDVQKLAQSQRQKLQTNKNSNASQVKIDQIAACVDKELEVIISLVDAEGTLEQLKDDRSIIKNRIEELKRLQSEGNTSVELELANLLEELEMRNTQIADIQQKICDNDMDILIRSISENCQNIIESRAMAKRLLKSIVEMRRDHVHITEELRTQVNSIEEKYTELCNVVNVLKSEHESTVAEYEEKIAVVLALQGDDAPKELRRRHKKKTMDRFSIDGIQIISPGFDDGVDDVIEYPESDMDPDWRITPMYHRSRKYKSSMLRKRSANGNAENSSEENNTNHRAAKLDNSKGSRMLAKPIDQTQFQSKLRVCKCRGNCRNQRCGCNSNNQKCTINCQCSTSCKNRWDSVEKFGDTENEKSESDGQQLSITNSIEEDKSDCENQAHNDTYLKPSNSQLSNKINRLSELNFKTPTSKKKFFD